MTTVTERNPELVDGLRADFQARYEPNLAWSNVCANHLALPGLRAFWPMSVVGYLAASRGFDVADGNHLTDVNAPDFAYSNLIPYVAFDGVNQELTKVDGGAANWADITGTETYILAGTQGLSLGGWFYPTAWPGAGNEAGLIAKWNDNAVNQRSYKLNLIGTNQFEFEISLDGTAVTTVTSTVTGTANNWYHIIGTFDPSTESAIFVNRTVTTNAVAIPASIFDSTSTFRIANYSTAATRYYTGYASLCWLAAMWYDDYIPNALFDQSKAMFGVN